MALTCEFLVLGTGCCDAGGIHAVCFACSGAGGIGGEFDALLQCGLVEVYRGGDADRVALTAADGSPGVDGLANGLVAGDA